jgi:peptide/nickel transport system permease protein
VALYILRRLLQVVPTLFAVSVVVFLLIRLVPGDPAEVQAGENATREQVETIRRTLGLARPLPVQYLLWGRNVLRLDLGVSYHTQVPVRTLVGQKLVATAELALCAMSIALIISIPVSIAAALRPNSVMDRVATTAVLAGLSLPSFCLGILLILAFSFGLQLLPPIGYVPIDRDLPGNLRFLVLPALTLGIILAAPIMRFMRAGMLDVLLQDYVKVAHAKGLPLSAVIRRHVMRNASLPTLTMVGLQFGELLGGTAGVETVFAWPGIGRLLTDAILQRDYVLIQAIVLLVATGFVLINLVVDLCYSMLDPRIRLG